MAIFSALSRYSNFGLLILRAGVGVMMLFHGVPKLTGGTEKWAEIGKAMENFGLHTYPAAWGFAAAFAEGVGGLLLVLGLFTRPALLLLLGTMIVAATMHLSSGDGISGASHAIELGFVYLGLFFTGPGRYSIDKK